MNDIKRILIVEDDYDLAWVLQQRFEKDGYQVTTFADGPDALHHVESCGLPHLAVIDLGLHSMHGFELSKRLKNLGDVPIVFISTDGSTDTIVDGLTRYAEDYVTKPFEPRELVARVQTILRRIPDLDYALSPVTIVDDRLSVDFGHSRLLINKQSVILTPIEAKLLHILIRNAGRVVSSDILIGRTWPTSEVYEDTLRVHIHRLRSKVELDPHQPHYIQTVRGVGYRFVALDTKAAPPIDATSTRRGC